MFRTEKFGGFCRSLNLLENLHQFLIANYFIRVKFDKFIAAVTKNLLICDWARFLDALKANNVLANHHRLVSILVNF